MTQLLTKYAAKKLLGKQMDKYKHKDVTNSEDPYFTYVPHPRKPGKQKKVKKQIPDYIPEHDAIILAKMRQRAYWLDNSLFNFAGIRFGWSSVIGLIPAAGDAIDAGMALLLFWRCYQVECKLDQGTVIKMLINIFIDFIVGLVPFIGDIADAAFRANSKNVRLLEKRLDQVYKPKALKEQDKRSGENRPPATEYEYFSDDEERLPTHRQDVDLRQPNPARVPAETRGGVPADTRRTDSRRSKKERDPRQDPELGDDGTYYADPPRDDVRRHQSTRSNRSNRR